MILIEKAKILIEKSFRAGSLLFSDKIEEIIFDERQREAAVAPYITEKINLDGGYVIPGLVDVHTHGAAGADFSDGTSEGFEALSQYYARGGVTRFFATTMTLPEERLTRALKAVKEFKGSGAQCAGVHLEGPFLSREKKGAQAEEFLIKPDYGFFSRLNEACGGKVKAITIAPELDGAIEFIKSASKECVVSLGHTSADYQTAMRAFEAGARRVTHLYNAMPPFLHRAPSVFGAAFDSGADVEIICDGLHLHPVAVRMAFRLFGDRINLISDSMRCAGLSDGQYELGGQRVLVRKGRAELSDGTLAGSSIHLMDAVKNAVRFGMELGEAVYAASTAPCQSLGLGGGKIEKGTAADLVLLDENLCVKAVYLGGKKFR